MNTPPDIFPSRNRRGGGYHNRMAAYLLSATHPRAFSVESNRSVRWGFRAVLVSRRKRIS